MTQQSLYNQSSGYPITEQSFQQSFNQSHYPGAQPLQQTFDPSTGYSMAGQPFEQTFNQTNYSIAQPSYHGYSNNATEPAAESNLVDSIPLRIRDAYESIIKNDKIENYLPNQDFFKIKKSYSITNKFIDNQFRANNDSVNQTFL